VTRRPVLAGALLGLLAPTLYAEAVRRLFRFNIARVNAGDPAPLFRSYAPDVVLTFPGTSSWAGTFRGREEVEPWVRRFVAVGLRLEPDDILVSGPPWNTRACLRFTDALTLPDGSRPYENTGVIYARIVWGRLKAYEVHENTDRTIAFDAWLVEHDHPGAPFPSVQDAAAPWA
jgi:ketosteroid isomerase-like protein